MKIKRENALRGFKEELIFCKCLEKFKGLKYRKANYKEDRFDHVDIFIENGMRVDVKAQKKINNSDSKVSEDFTWIEISNTSNRPGWLFGDSTHIAYAFEDHYKLFETAKLREFILSKVDIEKFQYKTYNPKIYTVYRRSTLRDKIVLVPIKDLVENVPYLILERDAKILEKEDKD